MEEPHILYDLYSEFDIEKHKSTYINYLEVIVTPDGVVHYAIPSHQEYLIQYGCKKYRLSRKEFENTCPRNYYCDYMKYLCTVTDCIAIWTYGISYGPFITYNQLHTIELLKNADLYLGPEPVVAECCTYFE